MHQTTWEWPLISSLDAVGLLQARRSARDQIASDVSEQLRGAHVQAQGDHFEHRQRDRPASTLHVGDKGAIDPVFGCHPQLRQIALPAQLTKPHAKAAADIHGEIIILRVADCRRVRGTLNNEMLEQAGRLLLSMLGNLCTGMRFS